MRPILASTICGILLPLFAFVELIRWITSILIGRLFGRPMKYPAVSAIWVDRSIAELVMYLVGLLVFLGWPLFPSALLKVGSPHFWRSVAIYQWFYFFGFTCVTLAGPVGLRMRYKWLTASCHTGYERLFVGQLPAKAVLDTGERWEERDVILREFLCLLIVLIIGPSFVNYAIWIDLKETAFAIPNNVPASDIEWIDFFYQSVVTITTTGFGDITPKITCGQFVSVTQIILGWLYLIGLLPILLARLQRVIQHEKRWHKSESARGGLLGAAIRNGLESLRQMCAQAGIWTSSLPSDVVPAYFAIWALEIAERDLPVSTNIKQTLESQIAESQSGASDTLGVFLKKLHQLRKSSVESDGIKECVQYFSTKRDLTESDEDILKWLGVAMFHPSSLTRYPSLLSVKLPDVEYWECQYGRHWSTYARLARLLYWHYREDETKSNDQLKELISAQSPSGSWFGDCLLTSLCVLALARVDKQRTAWHGAALWLAELVEQNGRIPLVSDLNIWHTALALEVMHVGGISLQPPLQWFVAQFLALPEGCGWSWSSESDVICLDSTSAVIHAVRNVDVRDIRIYRCIEAARETINSAIKNTEGALKVPTFIKGKEGKGGIEACPIILARSLSFIDLSPQNRRKYTEDLIKEIVQGCTSPWFRSPAITKGLVLWYVAPYLTHNSSTMREVVKSLLTDAENLQIGQHATRACILLGLLATRKLLDVSEDVNRTIERLINSVLASQEDGKWPGELIGVYGFGRLYADSLFSTVLSLHALIEYAAS